MLINIIKKSAKFNFKFNEINSEFMKKSMYKNNPLN